MRSDRRILIVDDEMFIRTLILQALEEMEDEGVELLTAENGRKALDIIFEERPNLVFLDVMMPQMNGFEVCRQVKNEPELKNTFIVFLTAKGQESDRIKGDEVAVDRYITKPFDPDLILQIATEVLGDLDT